MATDRKPSKALCEQLVDQIDQLVMPQANVFIRELVRDRVGVKPGANKAQNRAILTAAACDGRLPKEDLDEWLHRVEGWGNQHIYPFEVPNAIASDGRWDDEAHVRNVTDAAFDGAWQAPISREFPDEMELTRIDYDPFERRFVVEWHRKTESWVRDEAMDEWPYDKLARYRHPRATDADEADPLRKALLIDGDAYYFSAFRRRPSRSVMRFALSLPRRRGRHPIGALFVRVPIRSPRHREVVATAWGDLGELRFGGEQLAVVQDSPWNVSTLIKKLDSAVIAAQAPNFKSKATKFAEDGATVEFVAPALALPEDILAARVALTPGMSKPKLVGSTGDFWMTGEREQSRDAHVLLYNRSGRIKILTELDEPDVWTILRTFDRIRRQPTRRLEVVPPLEEAG